MDEPVQWARLAEAMRERRTAMKLSVRAAAQRAGIDRSTWDSAERTVRQLSRHLWPAVEETLGWKAGSVAAVLGGGDPDAVNVPQARSGDGLADEIERIRKMTSISPADRIRMIRALMDLYEEQAASRS